VKFNADDATVWKKPPSYSKYEIVFPILEKYELNFIPKILEWNNEGYTYEYINNDTLLKYLLLDNTINQKFILEIKFAMDDIWKKLYQISIENLKNNHFLFYNDPHLDNLIWKNDSKELILLDVDSITIGKYIPISYLNNLMMQQLEHHIIKQNWLFKNEY